MRAELSFLVEKIRCPLLSNTELIYWGSPIPSFGKIEAARIATLGLNPSNREFVDNNGKELSGSQRRFQTLTSLGITCWSYANSNHLDLIKQDCDDYFNRNPYDAWFKKLDRIISGTSMSYYFPSGEACHLDLIPFATSRKWSELSMAQQDSLLKVSRDYFLRILSISNIEILILNGRTVVNALQKMTNTVFKETHMPEWTLPRKHGDGIKGFAYSGIIDCIGEINLNKPILVLGYNHNIQSSFGVTHNVQRSIRNWITEKSKVSLHEKK